MGRPEPGLEAAVGALRAPVALGDRAVQGALLALEGEARRTRRRRVVAGLGSVGVLLLAALLVTPSRPGPRRIHFSVDAPAAGRVSLIGDFNDWDPAATPLEHHDGEWSTTLRLKPGRYRYSYVLDDSRWVADPGRPAVSDEFGTPTSVITVAN